MRKSDRFFLFISFAALLLGLALAHAHVYGRYDRPGFQTACKLARSLEITDLCLATEAFYTRHPSQADRHTPFQTHPTALEHFPTGAVIRPPDAWRNINVD